jgi:YesN/AraC family two-component response regulator
LSDYLIREAADGKLGLEMALAHIPDLIISDLMMPVMSGTEMCSRLKSDARTSHIPLIMLTARADKQSKIEGLETGADDYIVKPFDADELQVRVKNLIVQREKLKEKFRRDLISASSDLGTDSPQDKLLKTTLKIMNDKLSDPDFLIEGLADELSISKAQLYRKINALTGYTPGELLRTIRLNTAASLFKQGHKNVAQVMYQVGFNNQSNFARIFKQQFKLNPSSFIKLHT